MLGILLLIFIGQKFYKLAKRFKKKNEWLYAIIGIATYYAGALFIGGVILLIIIEFVVNKSLDDFSDVLLSFMMMPFGLVAVFGLHYILKKKFEKEVVLVKDEIKDIGKSIENLDKNN